MRKLIAVIGLEVYAVLLTVLQALLHVRTDEAKYLLNIPYPHPPLIRSILHILDACPYQEWIVRFVFASLLVQVLWLAVGLLKGRKASIQLAVAAAWLFSLGIITQAGTIMMAPLTALEAWIFITVYLRGDKRTHTGLIGLFWLFSLFTAYQAILFFPIVLSLLWKQNSHISHRLAAFFIPIALLALYTLTNPLVPASLLLHGDHDVSLMLRLQELGVLWLLSGSIVLSIIGLWGMFRERLWAVLCSFLIVATYVALARFPYYAILFVPLSMAGFVALVRANHMRAQLVGGLIAVVSVAYFLWFPLGFEPGPARAAMARITSEGIGGTILLRGSFGHEWQYESRLPVRRYTEALLPDAGAVVCLTACPDVDLDTAWRQISTEAPFIFIRR